MAGNPAMMVDPWGLDDDPSFIGPPAPTKGQMVNIGDGMVKIFNGTGWEKGVMATADRSTNWNGSWNIFGLIPKFDYSNSASSTDWSNTFKAVGNAAINLVNTVPELVNSVLYNAEMIHNNGISEYSSKLKELTVTEIASAYSYIAETPLQEIGGNVIGGLHTPQFAEGLYTLSFSVILARPSTSGAALARPKSVATPAVVGDNVAGGAKTHGGLTTTQSKRIQNFVDREGVEVTVVGSRARGTDHPLSDFDYVINASSSVRRRAQWQLPRGVAGGANERGMDIFQGLVRTNEADIPFRPKP